MGDHGERDITLNEQQMCENQLRRDTGNTTHNTQHRKALCLPHSALWATRSWLQCSTVIKLKSVLMCAAAKVSARCRHENAFDSSADLKIPHNDVQQQQQEPHDELFLQHGIT